MLQHMMHVILGYKQWQFLWHVKPGTAFLSGLKETESRLRDNCAFANDEYAVYLFCEIEYSNIENNN